MDMEIFFTISKIKIKKIKIKKLFFVIDFEEVDFIEKNGTRKIDILNESIKKVVKLKQFIFEEK